MKSTVIIFLFFLVCSCVSKDAKLLDNEYRRYKSLKKIPKKDSSFVHFEHFIEYKDSIKRADLINNKILKVNKVYSFYSETETQTFGTFVDEGKQSVTFVIYTDEETFCLSTFDLSSKDFSAPENGKIKLEKPIIVEHFGDYELTNDFLKTRKRNQSPYREWVDYQNGTIKNDTIFFTEKYIGKEYKFEKKWWAIKHKDNWTEIYQPNLKVVKHKSSNNLINFEVTGEFNIK